jgi:hypothetical protein
MIKMVYIKGDNEEIAVIYQKPILSGLRFSDVFTNKDPETGEDIYEKIYTLTMCFPGWFIKAKSKKFQLLAEIERSLSRISDESIEEKYQVEEVYVYSLGEDIANHLPWGA